MRYGHRALTGYGAAGPQSQTYVDDKSCLEMKQW